jgi:hypothetical protein
MKRAQKESVIDSMNAIERARALRGMHQAMLLRRLADALTSQVRSALASAGHAMSQVYGR